LVFGKKKLKKATEKRPTSISKYGKKKKAPLIGKKSPVPSKYITLLL